MRRERDELLAHARASQDQLRAAVIEYLHGLRTDGLPRERALELVREAVRESTEAIGVPELLVTRQRDAAGWVDEIYDVA